MSDGGSVLTRLTRRRFVQLVAASTVGAIATACGVRVVDDGEAGTATGAETPAPLILRNENQPDVNPNWNVRFIRSFEALDPEQWRLSVEGLVEQVQSLSLSDIMAWPGASQVSRMVCVEGWSSKAEWGGFTYQTLAEMVHPTPEAAWLHFECADGYYEALSTEELSQPRVLFAYHMDGQPLHSKFGAPLRLIVPPKYGYKGPKTITVMRFQSSGAAGYWPSVGPYTRDGMIQPGLDRPLDLEGVREISGGEVTDY